jgi:putative CocE/NonD family hydrolase
MGANEWREEHEWPLARTKWQKWYLHSNGAANGLLGDGRLSSNSVQNESVDTFTYNPEFPVQTVGGNNCCSPEVVPWGPYDQRGVEMRPDVLVYSSDPLEQDMTVIGPIKVVLHAATDGVDTDWTAKLVDVSPSGYAMNLCDGITRARYRESFQHPELLTADELYEYEINVGVTGNVFKAGHRVRLEISSSNFPRYDRNLNTGEDNGTSTETRSAQQTIYHSSARPSHVLLPVIPT